MQQQRPEQKPNSTIKLTNKRLTTIWLCLAVVVVTVSIVALWKMKFGPYRYRRMYYGVTVVDEASDKKAKESRDAWVAKANLIRDQWRPWAFQHRELLSQMLNARQGDQAVPMRVIDTIPVVAQQAGVTLTGSRTLHHTEEDRVFSWQPAIKGGLPHSSNPVEQAKRDSIGQAIEAYRKRDYAQLHDVALSQAMSFGIGNITVWASGRITERKGVPQSIVGQPATVEGVPHQIIPPFDFLQTTANKEHPNDTQS